MFTCVLLLEKLIWQAFEILRHWNIGITTLSKKTIQCLISDGCSSNLLSIRSIYCSTDLVLVLVLVLVDSTYTHTYTHLHLHLHIPIYSCTYTLRLIEGMIYYSGLDSLRAFSFVRSFRYAIFE